MPLIPFFFVDGLDKMANASELAGVGPANIRSKTSMGNVERIDENQGSTSSSSTSKEVGKSDRS